MEDAITVTVEFIEDLPEVDPTTDDRRGLPSASEYSRVSDCPGYLQLKRILPKKTGGSAGRDADSGTRIHAALAEPTPEKIATLDETEADVFDWCAEQWNRLEKKYGPEAADLVVEARIFMRDNEGNPFFSGQIDRALVGAKVILGTDYKTGRIAVEPVETNKQIRAYAVLLDREYPGRDAIYMSIIQPWVSKEPIVVRYDRQDLNAASAELISTLAQAEYVGVQRKPGACCRYCPCRADCQEGREYALAMERHAITKANPLQLATDADIADFLNRVSVVEKIIAAVRAEGRRRLVAGQEIPGWTLHPGRTLEEITEPEVLFARLSSLGVNQAAFMQAVKIGKTDLRAVLKQALGLKGKALQAALDKALDGCVTVSTAAAYLTPAARTEDQIQVP